MRDPPCLRVKWSALEWVVDQYQVKGESDPNREDDPGYIVR
jgi:predicted helicase